MSRKGGGEIEATRRACPFTTALKLASPTDAKLAAGSRFAVGRGANFPSAVSQGVAVTKHERMQKKNERTANSISSESGFESFY